MTLAPTSLTKSLVNLALLAGREIMAIYATDFQRPHQKRPDARDRG